ncbi:MAG: B12-binding domain-containing radical SAM protein [Deltaproteobacteria bacterium]|nr:B12-binding domain-containing radical SAM protein [Deltaproteobacteria bacterium]
MATRQGGTGAGRKRILLSGVFGPFGVDDAFGRKENIMELFHNQVTKAQGAASFRFHHRSFGLYFIAANVDADVTVLDFPSRGRFIRELAKGYDIVGISFIAPNFVKAREMARLARIHAPGAEIVLGGHGAAIEGVAERIDCDHVVRGEGIRWLREHLGQDPDAPIAHPILPTTEHQSILGIPIPGATSNLLVPGVGCVNGCSFCCTSHFFGKKYAPFLRTGKELFEAARRIADARGTDVFFVMDENFLKDKERAMALVEEMERRKRFFSFYLFSSAETITAFGVENLVRLGVVFLWIGFESKTRQDLFAKNQGIDARHLVRHLRDHGISVLASGILCMEHHTPDNMEEDIDFLVGLEADLVQFMLLMPLPVTAVYERFKKSGLLDEELPFEEWHGQKMLPWRHPAFTQDAPSKWLDAAFRKDFGVNSSSLFRTCETAFRGYRTLAARPKGDPNLDARREQLRQRVAQYALTLPAIAKLAATDLERGRALALDAAIRREFGPPSIVERVQSLAAIALALRWRLRLALFGDRIQPKTIITHHAEQAPAVLPLAGIVSEPAEESEEKPVARVRRADAQSLSLG